jgi:hypothetical protein
MRSAGPWQRVLSAPKRWLQPRRRKAIRGDAVLWATSTSSWSGNPMGLRGWVRRLERDAQKDVVILRLRDGGYPCKPAHPMQAQPVTRPEALRGRLRACAAEEREARRRADTIIAQLARANEEQARTIRELEAPSEPPSDERESPETLEEEPERAGPGTATVVASQEGTERRSWWQRWFGA